MRKTVHHAQVLAGGLVAGLLLALCAVSGAAAAQAPEPLSSGSAPTIVGGERASTRENPWAVYLIEAKNGNQFCGGTLVAPTKVVTAAHCLENTRPSDIKVVAGRDDKQSYAGVVATVSRIWLHPDYDGLVNDIAVVTLGRKLYQRTIRLASPADSALYRAGTRTTILGWGRLSEDGESSRFLRKAVVPVIRNSGCTEAYPDLFDPTAFLCAGFPQGGIDSCQGDSGGPQVAGGRLVGVVSGGDGCARPGRPGVYTRVSTHYSVLQYQIRY